MGEYHIVRPEITILDPSLTLLLIKCEQVYLEGGKKAAEDEKYKHTQIKIVHLTHYESISDTELPRVVNEQNIELTDAQSVVLRDKLNQYFPRVDSATEIRRNVEVDLQNWMTMYSKQITGAAVMELNRLREVLKGDK